jgi:N-acetylglucosaminyl-diphospho-decaprenol L-rhamnosyltransferase
MNVNRDTMAATAVIIVTHDSATVLESCLASLAGQSVPPDVVCIVDSGSGDTSYLRAAEKMDRVEVLHYPENIGFAAGNNAGFRRVGRGAEYVLFVNPDTFLDQEGIRLASETMRENAGMGILTGRLLGYDVAGRQATGRIDSTGIFRKWYGRWFDRGLGEVDSGQYSLPEDIPAACGALMFCRKKALEEVMLPDQAVFDPAFFLYKEDIELSLRLRKAGWRISYDPRIKGFHGRGWQRDRRRMSPGLRRMAARNELLLYRRHPSPYFIWALAKCVLVYLMRI